MEERKWEDLSTDCLVNIFGRLGVESLLLNVSLVCKPWYKATLIPLCWQRLVFPPDIFMRRTFEGCNTVGNRLIKLAVNRSQRSATLLVLYNYCTRDELIFFSDECPALKYLALPCDVVCYNGHIIPGLISKWKSLEILFLGNHSCDYLVDILDQISLHCKNFICLSVKGALIANKIASKIVTSLPNIKCLILKNAIFEKESLVMVLQGCKELLKLDVRNCIGFDEDDDEIIKLASQINNFCCEGSKANYILRDYDQYLDELGDDYYQDEIVDLFSD